MKLLRTLRIIDNDDALCLTHIALASCLIALVVRPGWETLVAFGLSLLNFNSKKWFAWVRLKKEVKDIERLGAFQLEIDRLQREFEKLNAAITFKQFGS